MSSRSCLSVKNDPYINELGSKFGLDPVVAHAEVGAWMELNDSPLYPTEELFKLYLDNLREKPINIYAGAGENVELSNFANRPFKNTYYHPINDPDLKFNSVELAFQYNKWLRALSDEFIQGIESDPETLNRDSLIEDILERILLAKTAGEAKMIGNSRGILTKEYLDKWDAMSSDIMKGLIIDSFQLNPDALLKLLNTGNATLTHTQDKGKWGKEFPRILMEVRDELRLNSKLPVISIDFQEELSSGYRERTIKNASADATIALAVDFSSAGERLTKSSVKNQNKMYIPIDANSLEVTDLRVDRIVNALNSVNAKTLNIAGNGLYTMKGKYTQLLVDDFTYNLLNAVLSSPRLKNKIESIRSGGLTGFDEAGTKAAVKLGIKSIVLAPKGWKFRNAEGKDIGNRDLFMARFENISTTKELTNLYEKLGNTTVSNFSNEDVAGVKIVPNPNSYLEEQLAGNAVVAYRNYNNPEQSFGNPFDDTSKTTELNVESFINWVISSNDNLAKWIRELILSGKYKGKPIYYGNTRAAKANVPSHATALDWLINSSDSPIKPKQISVVSPVTYNSVLQSLDHINKTFTPAEREERAIAIANLFSAQVDEILRESSEAGLPLSRLEIINRETTAGLFAKVRQLLEYARDTPDWLGWDQNQVDVASKTIDNFWRLADLSCRYLSTSEGVNFTIKGPNSTMRKDTEVNNETGEDTDINDPLYKEESLPEGWTINHMNLSSKSSLSRAVRRLLARIPSVNVNGEPERDVLGFPKYINADLAHSILIDKLRFMTKADELIPMLQEAAQIRAWVNPVIEMLQNDESLKSKFYVDFRKDFNNFQVVSRVIKSDGTYGYRTVAANKARGIDFLLDEWRDNYMAGVGISENSIYDSNNRLNVDNVDANIEKIKELQKSFRGVKEKDDFDTVANWVELNIDNISSVLQSIGISESKETILLALNRYPGNRDNKSIKPTHQANSIINGLSTMLTSIKSQKIGYDNNGEKLSVDWIKEFSKMYNDLAALIAPITDDNVESSTYENGKSYYSYQVPNYFNKYVKRFKHLKGEDFDKFIHSEFGQYAQFINEKTGDLKDGWVKEMVDNPELRDLFDIHTMLNFNKTDYSNLSELEYTTALIQEYFGTGTNNSAWYHIPILSDSPAGVFVKFKKYADGKGTYLPTVEVTNSETGEVTFKQLSYKSVLLKKFVTVAHTEYERINLVRAREAELKNNPALKTINNFESKGLEFQFFPKLNQYIELIDQLYNQGDPASLALLNNLYRLVIEESLNDSFQEAKEEWKRIGLLQQNEKGVYVHLDFKSNNEADVMSQLENYFWNSSYATTLIILMSTGDLAFYKNIEDFQKRNKQIYAPANRLNTDSKYGKLILKTVILKDSYVSSNAHLLIHETLRAAGMRLNDIAEIMSSYRVSDKERGTNQTDALAYSSLDSFRAIEDMMGDWTDEKLALYDKLIAHSKGEGPEFTVDDFNKLTLMQAKKPFVYTQKPVDSGIKDKNGSPILIKTPFLNKNSHYLITVAGLMARSPLMLALNDYMMKHNIDVIQFESAVKDGNQGNIDINNINNRELILKTLEENTGLVDGNNDLFLLSLTIHQIPYEDFGIQQPLEDHLTDYESLFGTLARKIISGDFPDDPNFELLVNGKSLNKTEWLKLYNNVIVENVLESFLEVRALFKDNKTMEELLLSLIRGNSRYSRDLEAAVTLDENGNFPIPLFEPAQSLLLQSLLSAVAKNRVTKQKIKGGQLVQVSNFGFSDDLSVKFKDKDGNIMPTFKQYLKKNKGADEQSYKHYLALNQAGIAYYEAYMPAYALSMVADFMDPETGKIDVNKLPDNLRKVIGYRIPTESHYSIVPIYIKGFLPSYAGTLIMLPSEITAVTGSDFDIDKMYMMIPEFKTRNIYNIREAWDEFYKDPANKDIVDEIDEEYGRQLSKYIEEETIDWDSEATEEELLSITDDFNQWVQDTGKKKYNFSENAQLRFNEWFKDNKAKFFIKKKYEKIEYNMDKETYQNKRAARNNLLIDMMWSVLTHLNTAASMLNPQSFDILKKVARVVTLLLNTNRDELKKELLGDPEEILPKMTLQKLENLTKKFYKRLNILSPVTQVRLHQLNMVAGKMIGIAANHNANHVLIQLTKVSLSDIVAFEFNGTVKKDLHLVKNDRGEYISRNVSGYLAASVDAVKDPVLNYINLNTFTADTTFLLARLGYSPLSIGLFMTQPIIMELTQYYKNNGMKGVSRDVVIAEFLNKYRTDNNLEEKAIKVDTTTLNLIKMMLMDRTSKEFYNNQYAISIKFTDMLLAADALSLLTAATRSDTGNGGQGPSFAHTEMKIDKVFDYFLSNNIGDIKSAKLVNGEIIRPDLSISDEDFKDEESINLLRNNIRDSQLPMILAFYSLGLKSQEYLVSKFFPHFKNSFRYVVDELKAVTSRNRLSVDTMNKVYSDLLYYIMTANDFFGAKSPQEYNDKFNYYTKDFVNEFKILKEDSRFRDNLLIKSLSVSKAGGNRPISSIRFLNVGALSPELKLQIMEAWADLMYHSDAGYKLANDLFVYNTFKNGFAFSPESFIHLAPTLLKVNIPQYSLRLFDVLEDNGGQSKYYNFVDQFLLNRTNIKELVPSIEDEVDFDWTDKNGVVKDFIEVNIPSKSSQEKILPGIRKFIIKYSENDVSLKPYVTKNINGKIYVFAITSLTDFTAIYTRVNKLGYDNNYLQYLYGVDAKELTSLIDHIVPEVQSEFSNDQYPDDSDNNMSSGLSFRSAAQILADARAKRQMEQLEKELSAEGGIEEHAFSKSQEQDIVPEEVESMPDEERAAAKSIIQNFRNKNINFSLDDLADLILRSIGGYGRDGNYRRYIKEDDVFLKVKNFNTKHPLRHKFVASYVKGWNPNSDNYIFYRILIKPRNTQNAIEANSLELNHKLNEKIRTILQRMGVSIGALNKLEEKQMVRGVMDPSQASNVVDGVVELIRLAKGDRGEAVLPEEFAHFVFEALGDNPLAKRLIELVSTGNNIQEILGDEYEAYRLEYNDDLTALAKEAVGKLLAKHFLRNESIPKKTWRNLLQRVIESIKKFWSNIISSDLIRARNELNSEFAKVAQGVIEGTYDNILSIQNINNGDITQKLFSLDERLKRDRAILKKMVEAETKLIHATERRRDSYQNQSSQRELVMELNKRLERGSHDEELIGISEYVNGAIETLTEINKKITNLYRNKNLLINVLDAAAILRDAHYIFTSYNSVLLDVRQDLMQDELKGDNRFDSKLIAQMSEALDIAEKIEVAYRELSVEIFSKFLEPFLGTNIKLIYKSKTGKNLDITTVLKETDHDIGMMSRWLDSMSRVDDLPSQLIDSAVKKQKNDARLKTLDFAKQEKAAKLKLEKAGITSTDWMFERDEDGNLTGSYISDHNSIKFHEVRNEFKNKLEAKYPNKDNIDQLYARRQEYARWEAENMHVVDGLKVPRADKFPSKEFNNLNSAQREYYHGFMERKRQLDNMLPPNVTKTSRAVMMRKDFLERILKSTNAAEMGEHFVDSIKDTFMRRVDDTDFGDFYAVNTVMDFEGNEMSSLPVYYIKSLENMNNLSLDTSSTIIAYAHMANDYYHMNKVIDVLEVGRNVLRKRDVQLTLGGKSKIESIKYMGRTIQSKLFKLGEGTNLVQRLNDYYSMLIYGRYMRDQGTIKGTKVEVLKLASFINKATSATTMWLGFFIGTTNALTGASQMNIEAAASEYFKPKDIVKADKIYFGNLFEHLGQLGRRNKTSKLALIAETFNAQQDSEQYFRNSLMDRRNILTKLFSMETLYFFSTSGEHWMHLRTVLAVMNTVKMKGPDGKITGLYEALERVYVDPNNPSLGAKLKVKAGYTKEDGSEFTQDDINEITNRTATINQDLHGVYNKMDKDAFQSLALGSMIEMFRKWMVRSFERRYSKAKYIVELDQEVEGFYRTMGSFMLTLAKDLKRMQFFTASKRFKELNPHEKANIRRALMDVTLALFISSLLAYIDWDGDDDNWFKNALEYQLRRERTELMAPMPLPQGMFQEGLRILQSPMAGMTFITNTMDLLQFWNWFDKVSRGRYEGDYRIEKDIMELLPLNKTIYGIMHPEERLLFYKRLM